MKRKKGLKYYAKFYVFVLVAYVIYIVIIGARNGEFDATMLGSMVYLPIMFVGLVWLFDSLLEPFFKRIGRGKQTGVQEQYREFFTTLTNEVNTQCEFSIEDFRRLRENERFQKALQQSYKVMTEGETPDMNFTLLDKKFKKDSREYEAMQVVIKEVKKMMTNDGKDYQK
ncbi:hypothetical protein [Candidatus Xianfuyuplasma coldseepsis]|uniref:Uncharacterized protein n=1 Tax=Candidatus Xianfuyuplasma coldseepsis TaxID=2782163 RepID=A0A7L7KQ97_9MOLU|nr:hypothetical protein [Xianfuyuplasma coldseepsis]QMS84971.1 hypothetical protein G4Z02_04110 [Xianfuyuplasma coldseepsis]